MRMSVLLMLAGLNIAAAPATSTAPWTPTFPRIQLTGEAITPTQLFDEITADTGIKFKAQENLWAEPERAASVDVKIDGPFWPAVQQACRLSKVTVDHGGDGEIVLHGGSGAVWGDYPVVSSDLGTVVAEKLTHTAFWGYARPKPDPQTLQVHMLVYVDPRVTWMQAAQPLRMVEARDDAGGKFTLVADRSGVNSHAPWKFMANATFHTPAVQRQRLAVLRGELKFTIASNVKPWTIDNVLAAANVEQRVCGYPVTIEKVTQAGERYQVKLKALAGGRSQNEFEAFTQVLSGLVKRVELLDGAGESYEYAGTEGGYGSDHLEKTLTFKPRKAATGKAAKLVWPVPRDAVDVALPFEFRDLKLP